MINCPQCNEENPPKFRLCGYCGTPLVAAAPGLPAREVRRTVTIIFCDLKGSTELGGVLDPEALHELKDRYFAAMAAEITRHGGKIEKYIGDAIMAVFGFSPPPEDDAPQRGRGGATDATGEKKKETPPRRPVLSSAPPPPPKKTPPPARGAGRGRHAG